MRRLLLSGFLLGALVGYCLVVREYRHRMVTCHPYDREPY